MAINLSWLTKKIVWQAELSRHSSSLERDELILFFAGCFCTLTNRPQGSEISGPSNTSGLLEPILQDYSAMTVQAIWRSRSPVTVEIFREIPRVYSYQKSLYPGHPLLQSIMINRTNGQKCRKLQGPLVRIIRNCFPDQALFRSKQTVGKEQTVHAEY